MSSVLESEKKAELSGGGRQKRFQEKPSLCLSLSRGPGQIDVQDADSGIHPVSFYLPASPQSKLCSYTPTVVLAAAATQGPKTHRNCVREERDWAKGPFWSRVQEGYLFFFFSLTSLTQRKTSLWEVQLSREAPISACQSGGRGRGSLKRIGKTTMRRALKKGTPKPVYEFLSSSLHSCTEMTWNRAYPMALRPK